MRILSSLPTCPSHIWLSHTWLLLKSGGILACASWSNRMGIGVSDGKEAREVDFPRILPLGKSPQSSATVLLPRARKGGSQEHVPTLPASLRPARQVASPPRACTYSPNIFFPLCSLSHSSSPTISFSVSLGPTPPPRSSGSILLPVCNSH